MSYFLNSTYTPDVSLMDGGFMHNKTPIKDGPIEVIPNQTMFMEEYIDDGKYNVMKGFKYIWKALPIITVKHVVIDPGQDGLMKLLLDKFIKFVPGMYSNYFAYVSVKPNLDPGTTHKFMHQVFSPVLKFFGLDAACNHNHRRNNYPIKMKKEDFERLGISKVAPFESDEITPLQLKIDNPNDYEEKNSVLQCGTCSTASSTPGTTPSTRGTTSYTRDTTPHASYGSEGKKFPSVDSYHVHRPKTFIDELKEEYIIHAGIKLVAINLFPVVYLMKKTNICIEYAALCSYGATAVKVLGINPLELMYAMHSIIEKTTPKAYGNLVANAEFYLNYQHLRHDQEAYEFLQALDQYLEAVDAGIHAVDNIELLYMNRNLPGVNIITSAMAIVGGTLYYNTNMHESGLVGEHETDLSTYTHATNLF